MRDEAARAGTVVMKSAVHWPLYSKLSGFYFLYFATAGIFVPYWSLYLHEAGYSATQIGAALAVVGMVRVAAPLGWGWLMDRLGLRMRLIGAAMAVAALSIGAISVTGSYAGLLAGHFAFALFWNATIPAFDVNALGHVSRVGVDYPRMRLWGSIGFIVAVAAMGPVLDRTGLLPLPWMLIAGMLLMTAMSRWIPDSSASPAPAQRSAGFLDFVRQPTVLALFGACFLVQMSFAPFFSFFSMFLSAHGYDRAVTGNLWAVGVLSEVGVFLFAGRMISRYGARAIFLLALGTSVLRWLSQAWLVDSLVWLTLTQLLHLSSGGLYHAVSLHLMHRSFPADMQGRAQALLAGVSYGLGGSLGSYATGLLWDGDGRRIYLLAAAVAGLAFALAWRGVHETPRSAALRHD